MTTVSTITEFTGPAPSTADPDNFDPRADTLFSELIPFVPDINTTIGEINTVAGEVNDNKVAAETAENKAEDWADEFVDVEVETDKYSAKHWASKSEENKNSLLASANFAGNWSDLTGSLNIPACVYHSSMFWQLASDLVDVTAKEPGVDSEWINTNTGIQMNKNSIDSDLVIPEGYNALSIGHLDINAEITINKNSTWEIT